MPLEPGPEGTKYVRMEINFWYDRGLDEIHISSNDVPGFHIALIGEPNSRRGHPTLHKRLKAILQEVGRWPEEDGGEE